MSKVICVTSGGGYSATNGFMMLSDGHEVIFLNIDHGQKPAAGERAATRDIVNVLKTKDYKTTFLGIDAKWLGRLGGSGLTDKNIPVPEGLVGTYGSTIGTIFTPNRNSVLLGIAGAVAEKERAEYITFGCNQSEVGYPDNTKEYLDAYTKVLEYSCYHIHPKVISPEWLMDKVEIYKWSFDNGFGWAHSKLTYSCDNAAMDCAGAVASVSIPRVRMSVCGKCGCCRNRRIVFKILNTLYPDKAMWDDETYSDADWFNNTFIPEIRKRGIPKNKWFSKYANILGCKVID